MNKYQYQSTKKVKDSNFFFIFYNILANIKQIFSGKNLLWHLLFIALTWLIVTTNLDWHYFLIWHDYLDYANLRPYIRPAIALGGILPIFVPLLLILFKKTRVAGFAIGQAGILGLIISSTYKAFTGRMPPRLTTKIVESTSQIGDKITNLVDTSHGFQIGFLRGGVFWGWPSSHTTVAFSIAFALITLYPKNKWLGVPVFLFALYIGFGVSTSIHWLSEFIAGAILGTIIGITVGKSFKKLEI